MTGPSTMKHHQELHEHIRALEASVKELLLENDALRQADDEHHQEARR